MPNPTIVTASLSDEELKKSIDTMVKNLNDGLEEMKKSTDSAVAYMQKSLQRLGNTKIDTGGSSDGGSSKRAKAQNEETAAVEKTVAARDKEIKKNKEAEASFDQVASAMQKATKKRGVEYMAFPSDVDKSLTYLINVNKDVDAQMDAILKKEQELIEKKQKEAQVSREIREAQQNAPVGVSGVNLGWGTVHDMQKNRGTALSQAKEIDYLRQQIAAILDVKESDIRTTKVQSSTYNQLADYLKQLQTAYKSLSADNLKREGSDIAAEIQKVQRAMQQWQTQMSRPVSLSAAMGLSDKTLDDMAYKLRMLQSYKMGLNITDQKALKEMRDVDLAIAKLKKDYDDLMGKNQQLFASNTMLGRSWNYMKNRLMFYFTVGASTQFVKNLIDVRSQYEMNERALGILIDSAERGTQIFNELSQMALVSPYTLIELSTAAKQLTAYDVAAKDVVDTTRRLADMAAAVGIPIERLTYALGQIKAYGYLNSRDARMFANAGIPLVKQLSDYYTELEGKLVSTADVYDRIKKKSIDYNEVMEVVNKMTDQGGKFFDFQAKMADTLKVRLANLTLAWNNMLNDIGKSSQGMLTWGIGALRKLFLHWKQFNDAIYSAAWAGGLIVAIRALNVLLVKAGLNWRILSKEMTTAGIAGAKTAGILRGVGSSLATLAKSPLTWWSLLAFAIVDATRAIINANEAQKDFNDSVRKGAQDNYKNVSEFLEQYQKVRDSLYSTKKTPIGSKYDPSTGAPITTSYAENTVTQDIDKREAKKVWEVIREQIELTTKQSDEYISRLLAIENVSERVRQGFDILEDIKEVNAALKDLDDDSIKITNDWSNWWNIWLLPDGLIENLGDFVKVSERYRDEYGSIANLQKVASEDSSSGFSDAVYEHNVKIKEAQKALQVYEGQLERFREDLKVTTGSILNFIELKGWSGDINKINAVFEQISQKLILDNQLDPKKAFALQLEIEEARSEAAKSAQIKRVNDLAAAYKRETDKQAAREVLAEYEKQRAIYDAWEQNNGRTKVEWERFTKWLKEQHISETTAAFRNMDAEQIKSQNFQEGKYHDFVMKMATQYAKENKMSIDEVFEHLGAKLNDASTWSLVIPVLLDIKPLSWLEEDFKKRLPNLTLDVSNYKKLSEMVSDFQKKRKEGLEEIKRLEAAGITSTKGSEADIEHYKEVEKEVKDVTAALKAYNAPLEKETKGNKKDRVLEALKQEVSLVEKLQGNYDKLVKSGASQADALAAIRSAYGKTISQLNNQLKGFGLPEMTTQLITGKDPHKALEHFNQTLEDLVSHGMLNLERSKVVEGVVEKFTISAKTYDMEKITKGLNNELDKLKDEYELAVELDANPELGDMFADMFKIDTSDFPKTIDEYMQRVQNDFDAARNEFGYMGASLNVFQADENTWKQWGEWVGLSGEALDKFKAKFVDAQNVAKKWATDVVNDTKKLEYELADLNDKIAIKEKEQALLHERIEKEKNETTKHYLELTYQSNEKAIDELRAQALSLMPEYARVFNSIAEYSAGVSRRLQRDLMKVFDEAKYDSASGKWTLTGSDGKQTILNDTQYRKEREKLTKEMRKSQSPFNKIKEAFKPSDKNGVVDYAKGIELVSAEVQKLASVASEVGNLAQIFGADEQTVEIINDVATSLNGVATAGEGISKIAEGDYIGGAASVLSGITSIIGAWADNDNKKIDAEIKESELAVKRLENAYKNLEVAIENAAGAAVIGAKQAAIANKELQLAELERQLRLEESRSSKDKDEDKIADLKGQIIDLRNEIKKSFQEVVTSLLGISDVSSAAEDFMNTYIESLRKGEDAQRAFSDSWKEMIANMIKQIYVTKVIAPQLNALVDEMNERITNRSKKEAEAYRQAVEEQTNISTMSDYDIQREIFKNKTGKEWKNYFWSYSEYVRVMRGITQAEIDAYRNDAESRVSQAKENLDKVSIPTINDLDLVAKGGADLLPILEAADDELKDLLERYDLYDKDSNQLSSLQQGIQGITEDTAGALEGITNGISQQCYLQSDLLTQIRDAVVSMDMDVSLGVMSQILLQLQSSYQIQQSMLLTMENWTNPSGNAVRVELIS